MGKKYMAAIYRGPGKIDFEEKELAACGDDDVIVKNRMSTICGADFNAFNADGDAQMVWRDSEFGHEMVSEVVEIGKNVKGVEIGDWLFLNMGYAHHDRHRMSTVGGFSEYLYLPRFTLEGNFDVPDVNIQPSAIKLDKSLGLDNLCLMEPFSIGCKAAKSLEGRGKTAVVIGAGIIGMSTAIMLKYYGFEKVMSLDLSDFRLSNAQKFGLLTCNPQKEDLEAKLFETFGSRQVYGGMKCMADCWVDCIGIQPCIDYFNKYGGFGATFCIVGVHHQLAKIDAVSICYNQQWIKGCGSYNYKNCINDISDMIRKGTDISQVITQKFPHKDLVKAIKTHGNFEIAQKVAIVYD